MRNGESINLCTIKSKTILKEYNISIPDNFIFSKANVVIGTNGCGKSRFLRAVRDIYRKNNKNKVMYGYFPNLSSNKKSVKKSKELPPYTLYESLQNGELEFDDFLKEIERQNDDFIPQLLTYQSRLQKERGEKALDTLIDVFSSLSEKEIFVDNSVVFIRDKQDRVIKLKEAILDFSPGELMIFYISVFISLQKNSGQKSVIILDEPECHLHPKALLKFIQILKESDYFSSIWIATHSLFLVPEFEFKELVYIDNSSIVPRRSTIYKNIFTDLLGDDIIKTTQFLSSLSQWEYCQYMAECFLDPDVVDTVNPKDEQVILFLKFIETHPTLKVLDFGGGSARLGLSLLESENYLSNKIKYDIYDPKPEYKGKKFTIYRSIDKIKDKYDCVVMMNVLHEIEPKEWKSIFMEIHSLLNEGGYLLFVETAVLNKGEMPTKEGFLVLGFNELQTLFSSLTPLTTIKLKENQKSICVPIPKDLLKRVSQKTINDSIATLESQTYEKLIAERSKASFQTSRYYAFLTQQYLNAKLYVESTISKTNNRKSLVPSKPGIEQLMESILKDVSTIKFARKLRGYLDNKVRVNSNTLVLYQMICKALDNFILGESVTKIALSICWSNILQLEKEHEPKEITVLFLLCLYILGDKKSANRINSNYLVYVERIVQEILMQK